MASSSAVLLILQIFLLAATQDCCAESGNTDAEKMIAAMQGVSQAIERFGGMLQESLRFQKQNSDALTSLGNLPAMISQVKNQVDEQTGNISYLRKEVEEISKVEALHRENEDLKRQLDNKDKKVEILKTKLEDTSCQLPEGEKIKKLVQTYRSKKDWGTLRRGLEETLNPSSEAYKQLQGLEYNETAPMFWIGDRDYTQLAKVLVLCGRAVNVRDGISDTMLHGAKSVELARWLLDHGADIDAANMNDNAPLSVLAYNNMLDAVKFLVQEGANATAKNIHGYTALSAAKKNNRTAVVEFLSKLPH